MTSEVGRHSPIETLPAPALRARRSVPTEGLSRRTLMRRAIGAEAPIIVGPDHERFWIPSLVVGRYRFSCLAHPNMAADLVVDPF